MKSPEHNGIGGRIASVHNGSSLFTGDAGGGESNIRRYIIENDLLNAIVQLPNNLFYNTGITTYIWLLSNNKPQQRKGKVQLIDASLMFRKLRKNLGNKNCEFAPEHIAEIMQTYLAGQDVERQLNAKNDPIGIASKVFDNQDFGYYKVNIERPDRRRAQFSAERLQGLRFDKSLSDPMEYMYSTYGDDIYSEAKLDAVKKEVLAWCEDQEITLNNKAQAKLFDVKHWNALKTALDNALSIMQQVGTDEFSDFNLFKKKVDEAIKALKIKLSNSEKNNILNAVSWYDENAEKVVKKVVKLNDAELADLVTHLGCTEADLADFGYYATAKKGEFTTYESNSDLRDSESVPLKQQIHQYFLDEVKPHVAEAWINLDSVKIGYEISFNKYFYQHKPLRSLEEVAQDILSLEKQADGLIAQILGL